MLSLDAPNPRLSRVTWLLVPLALLSTLGAITAPFLMSYDDIWFTLENPLIKHGLGAIGSLFSHDTEYTPLPFISLYVDHLVFGDFAGGYRLVNALIHGLSAVLVYRLAMRLSGRWESALLAALLFTLHPTTVESVAWINQRRGLLALFCGLLSLWTYVSTAPESAQQRWPAQAAKAPSARRFALAWGFLLLAQFSKKSAVSFGVVFAALELLYFADAPIRRATRTGLMLLPCLLSALWGLSSSANHLVAPPGGESVLGRLIGTLYLHGQSWTLFFWPLDLSAFYYVPPIPPFGAAAALAIAMPILFVALYRRLGLEPRRALLLLAWVVAGLAPSMNPFRGIAFTLQDRYLYVALPALAILSAEILVALRTRLLPQSTPRMTLAVAGLLCVILGYVAAARSFVWRSELRVFSDAAARQPRSAFGHAYLASYLFHVTRTPSAESKKNVMALALAEHEAALRCDDYDHMVYPLYIMVEHATLRLDSGDTKGANELFEKVIRGRAERPTERGAKMTAIDTFAARAVDQKDFALALQYVNAGLELYPDEAKLLQNRMLLWLDLGRRDEARTEARRLLNNPALAGAAREVLKRLGAGN